MLGSLQWLTTQSRADVAFHVNQLQKRVNMLKVRDLVVANKVVRMVKKRDVGIQPANDLGLWEHTLV